MKPSKIFESPIVLGAIAIFLLKKGVLDPLLESLNLKESSEDRESKKSEDKAALSVFNPNYYKANLPCTIITTSSADLLSKRIYDAMGFFNDDEAAVFGVFRQLKSKCQVSFLSERFYLIYKKDLLSYLKTYFNQSEMNTVFEIVNRLPIK